MAALDDRAQQIICRICLRPLAHVVTEGYRGHVGTWQHHEVDRKHEDHKPEVVTLAELPPGTRIRYRCDFCLDEDVVRVLRARDFAVAREHGSVGNWGACEPCADLIDAGDWDALATRASEAHCKREVFASRHIVERNMRTLYGKLRKHALNTRTEVIG